MFSILTKKRVLPLIAACSVFLSSITFLGMLGANASGTITGMTLNFESGKQNILTGTHPGYEAYYGAPGAAANGNASRIRGFNVGYINGDGAGHNSDGAMRIAYSSNSDEVSVSENAGFNVAHTGTSATELKNFRPRYGLV